ncbi:MAG TPA: phosphoribosylanthranilate isomerase [Candidatus Tyrphobacter sp.]
MRTRVKFCGCTNWADVEAAIDAGADAIGMIFTASPRHIAWPAFEEIARRIPPLVTPVGVFADPKRAEVEAARDVLPNMVVQLHGNESGTFVSELGGLVVKVVHVAQGDLLNRLAHRCEEFPDAMIMFDTARDGRSEPGAAFAWEHVAPIALARPIVLAGGLTPRNVADSIRTVRPYAVDARSGIEDRKGRKDPRAMAAFVKAVRLADEE